MQANCSYVLQFGWSQEKWHHNHLAMLRNVEVLENKSF